MFNRNWNNVATMDVKLWRGSCLNISPKNAAEVFKSKRSRLIGKITLRDFEESHTKLASKVLKHIRDIVDLKCERLNFVNCNLVQICPKVIRVFGRDFQLAIKWCVLNELFWKQLGYDKLTSLLVFHVFLEKNTF